MITDFGILEAVRELANEVDWYLATRIDHAEWDNRGLDMSSDNGISWEDFHMLEDLGIETQGMLSTIESRMLDSDAASRVGNDW